jgi:hypothetical protein
VLQVLKGAATKEYSKGFHMVKCRGQNDLNNGKTVQQGLLDEEHFFHTNYPWNEIDKHLLGVKSLKKKLEALQIDMIHQSLPKIIQDINTTLKQAEEVLQEVGEDLNTHHQRFNLFIKYIVDATLLVVDTVKGKSNGIKSQNFEGYTWLAELMKHFRTFREDIYETKLVNFSNNSDSSINNSVSSTKIEEIEKTKNYEWLVEVMKKNATRELPCFLDTNVFNNIINELINEEWKPLIKTFCDRVVDLLENLMKNTFEKTIPKAFNNLKVHVHDVSKKLCNSLIEIFLVDIDKISIYNSSRAFTQNHYLTENIQHKRMNIFENMINPFIDDVPKNQANVTISNSTNTKLSSNNVNRKFRGLKNKKIEDDTTIEMYIALEAYGKVAVKRVIDEIPMIILQMFEEDLPNKIRLELLQNVDEKELQFCFHESVEVANKRKNALERMNAMKLALKELNDLKHFVF